MCYLKNIRKEVKNSYAVYFVIEHFKEVESKYFCWQWINKDRSIYDKIPLSGSYENTTDVFLGSYAPVTSFETSTTVEV
jgi:hypothetical protein